MAIKDHIKQIDLPVVNVGDFPVVLGHKWLLEHNPTVNWRKKMISFPDCHYSHFDPLYIWVHTNIAMELAIEANKKKELKTLKEVAPKFYWKFAHLFDKKEFDKLPPWWSCDHAIKLLPNVLMISHI
jgi:hypothetical protein